MAENVMEQIVSELRQSTRRLYPAHSELRNVRVVGHTPKTDHYIYDIVIDFADGSERAYAKVYRAKGTAGPKGIAATENANLKKIHDLVEKGKLVGVPRPLGDFSAVGAVVAEKLAGIPMQSIIMKAALLPGYADHGMLDHTASNAGEWLKAFHKATSETPANFDNDKLVADLERLCASCKGEGLEEASVRTIMDGAKVILARNKKPLPSSAVLNDFTPLNITLGDTGVGFCDFAKMTGSGNSLQDVALFLASVEALEKYPFCNRMITAEVQERFVAAYGASEAEQQLLRVLKMKALLSMFAQGRTVKESAVRKKVMWANVMKRFIQQAADRSMTPAA
jgi:hypothetical protein